MKAKKRNFFLQYIKNLFLAFVRKIVGINRFKRKKYFKRKILSPEESNDFIYKSLLLNKKTFIARLGDVECRLLLNQEQVNHHMKKRVPNKTRKVAFTNAGMFETTDEGIKTFHDIFCKHMKNVTGFCVWFNQMEDYLIDTYSAESILLSLDGLESYLYKQPWTSALKGKKVLVISPFAETIKQQYMQNREKLFINNPDTLPEFFLTTYKSFYTLPGEKNSFKHWSDVLLKMKSDCMQLDFDVAIIGCGSYGLALAGMLFEEGKSVIHAGGVTQVFFGVRGKRWDQRPYMEKYINDSWVRPSFNERPSSASNIEGGCYW